MAAWWQGWVDWRPLLGLDLKKEVPASAGAYAISVARPVPRLIGVDKAGILHVGESEYLRSRIRKFLDCARCSDYGSHMAGWRYRHVGTGPQYRMRGSRKV